jgi:formate dehydrogenase assembly factor FdhD
MEALIKILVAIEPVLVGAISLGALVLVPVIVKAILEKLNQEQQRFAYKKAVHAAVLTKSGRRILAGK